MKRIRCCHRDEQSFRFYNQFMRIKKKNQALTITVKNLQKSSLLIDQIYCPNLDPKLQRISLSNQINADFYSLVFIGPK